MSGLNIRGEDLSPEVQAVRFEWTPELEAIRGRGYKFHPDIPSLACKSKDEHIYEPGMLLPEPTDKRGMLRFCGINDAMIDRFIEEYQRKHNEAPEPPLGYEETVFPSKARGLHFPVADRLYSMMQKRDQGDIFDYEDTYDGKIKKGIQQGLRPEFAIFCSLYGDDNREDVFGNNWPNPDPPQSYVTETEMVWMLRLQELWSQKLEYEGKAKRDERGNYLLNANGGIVS